MLRPKSTQLATLSSNTPKHSRTISRVSSRNAEIAKNAEAVNKNSETTINNQNVNNTSANLPKLKAKIPINTEHTRLPPKTPTLAAKKSETLIDKDKQVATGSRKRVSLLPVDDPNYPKYDSSDIKLTTTDYTVADDYKLNAHSYCCSIMPTDFNIFHAVSEVQGERDYMEDRHRIIYNHGMLSGFFAVFDGHSGYVAAAHATKFLHDEILTRLENNLYDIGKASSEAFHAFDKKFLSMAEQLLWDDGCTSCVVMIHEDSIYCANAGDSRAVLSRNGKAFELSIDHKPGRDCEKTRIYANGGTIGHIQNPVPACFGCLTTHVDIGPERVYPGGIALSRGLGDINLKLPSKGVVPSDKLIICDPEIIQTKITPKDEFIIIGSDGFWDAVSSQEAVEMTMELILHGDENDFAQPQAVANYLTDYACQFGTGDNVTVILVFFKENMEARCTQEIQRLETAAKTSKPRASTSALSKAPRNSDSKGGSDRPKTPTNYV